jgi:hypothetical protein
MKTTEKKVRIRFLIRNIWKVKGRVKALGWELKRMTSELIIHMNLHNPTISWLMHSWNIFGAQTSHEHTWTHKTHHGLDLKEATTFPLYYSLWLAMGANIQMSFCPNVEILKIGTPSTLEGHNFLCRPLIEFRSKAKL